MSNKNRIAVSNVKNQDTWHDVALTLGAYNAMGYSVVNFSGADLPD